MKNKKKLLSISSLLPFLLVPAISSCKSHQEAPINAKKEVASNNHSDEHRISVEYDLNEFNFSKGKQYELQKLVRNVKKEWDLDLNQLWNSITKRHSWANLFIDRFDKEQISNLLPWSSQKIYEDKYGRIIKNNEKVTVDDNYKDYLKWLDNYLVKDFNSLNVEEKLTPSNSKDSFFGVFKYKLENTIYDANDFFVNFVKLDSPEYLDDIWTNVFFVNKYSELEEYVSGMDSAAAKKELRQNLLPKIQSLFENNKSKDMFFSVAIIPTYNENMFIRNMYYDNEKGNLIAKMSFLNSEQISDKLNLLIVPIWYKPKFHIVFEPWKQLKPTYDTFGFPVDETVYYSRKLSSKFTNIDNFIIRNKRTLNFILDDSYNENEWINIPYHQTFEWTLLTYTANLYFDNLFYCYLDHFINGQSYTFENFLDQEAENKFIKFLSYKLRINELDARNFFNKIQNLEKLNYLEIPLLKKWVMQDFKDYDKEIDIKETF
ncbi:hypothetical protein [Mycoplasmopsis gallinacea]|uniref:Lipoprotein n=1 Tax=Mycoplasmopsis gallinacea TaxID=29556 RepID=A0A6H0V2I9_9BACT|nr:hypothetical protein [Mycoplasmopsis gallinacea]QIW61899.1 hypothetical protein GOQ20_00205 [Mycoplasmopsis gallinacea]